MPPECKVKSYPRTCLECNQNAVYSAEIVYQLQAKHDAHSCCFQIPHLVVDKCQRCGEELFTSRTNHQVTEALRESLGLLHPEDILHRVGDLGLTQNSFAERIGLDPEVVSCWLNGLVIQTRRDPFG
jgi:hypothetical protein